MVIESKSSDEIGTHIYRSANGSGKLESAIEDEHGRFLWIHNDKGHRIVMAKQGVPLDRTGHYEIRDIGEEWDRCKNLEFMFVASMIDDGGAV